MFFVLNRRHWMATAGAAIAATAAPRLLAQPSGKSVRVVVPYPAGGATDVVARLLAEKLRGRYAPTIIVDNRAGGAGRVGVENVKNGDADGSLILFTPDFPITIFPHIYRKLAYELRDFMPVASCATTSFALSAGPALPESVRTMAEFLQWCKANPKLASYAAPSAGSTPHFIGVMLARETGVDLVHVAYKGGALAVQDLLGGQVPVSINPIGEILQHARVGKLRVLATTGAARSRFLPDAPTLVEAGYRNAVVQSWIGMLVPARTPSSAVVKLNADVLDVLKEGDVIDSFARFGMDVSVPASASGFADAVKQETDRWGPIVRSSGFTAED